MARALITRVLTVAPDDTDLIVEHEVVFQGADVPRGIDLSMFTISIADADSLTTIRTKMLAAVRAEATRVGLTIPANQIIIPSYTRG